MTQHISTAQKARMSARRVSGGKPNRGVGLFCCRSMLSINGCLFRLGGTILDLGGTKSKRFPFLPRDPGLPKDAHQQAAPDVLGVRIRDPKFSSAPLHVLVVAAGHGWLEAPRTEAGDEALP